MTFVQDAGSRLGRYRLVQRIGEGGMGVVHLALDDAGHAVAIKVLRPHVAGDPVARQRLAREVESLRRVHHPRVAEVLDADAECETPYIVTQYVPAPPLDVHVREAGPLSAGELARLGNGLGEALAAIHQAGVVHRDLKPGNVLMLDGDPVVIDFGIAHVADDPRLTSTGLVMGTPGYLSPEVLAGQPVVHATDWWGWAATMAFAATGRPPFGRGPVDVVLDRVRRGEFDLDGVPAALVPVLSRALDPDVARRPEPGELRVAVGELVSSPSARNLRPEPDRAVPRTAPLPAVPAQPARPGPAVPGSPRVPGVPQTQRLPAVPASVGPSPAVSPQPTGPRARRTGTLLAGLVALVAVAAVVPMVAAIVGFAGSVLARSVDITTGSLLRRRYERGPRRGDVVRAALASPVHLTSAALVSVPAAVLPVLVGAATVFVVGWVVGPGGSVAPGDSLPLAAGALAAALTAWGGPGGGSLRRGSRTITRALAPGEIGAQVAVGLLAVLAVGAVLVVLQTGGEPDWTPLPGPPLDTGN